MLITMLFLLDCFVTFAFVFFYIFVLLIFCIDAVK